DPGASVLRGEPVPSGVPLASVGAASAVLRVRRGRPRAWRVARMTMSSPATVRVGAVTIGGGAPLAPIGGPYAIENGSHAQLSTGNRAILLTERGSTFGYNTLVVDMRGLADMRALGYPVVFDATHSVQLPGGAGDRSAGERAYVPALARAAVAFGIDALFMEMHEDPDRTLPDGRPLSDGPNMLRIDELPRLLDELRGIESALGR